MGVSRDFPNFYSTPYYLRNAQSYKLQIWQIYLQGPSKQKPVKNLREKGAWAYPGTAQIFSVPPIVSGTRKDMNFKFDRCIHSVHANKMPSKICEKRVRRRTQGLPKFLQYPLLSQERVKLRSSNLADIFTAYMRTKAVLNICEKRERGRIQGRPNFFQYPLLSQERVEL